MPDTILPVCIGVEFRLSSKSSAKLSLIIYILDSTKIVESPLIPAYAGSKKKPAFFNKKAST
jgi:hypothetical protein